MSILVVGATGIVGGEIAHKLVQQGQQVSALIRGGRSHSKAAQLTSAGVEVIEGDLARPETLSGAAKGKQTVICTASSMPMGANDGLRTVDHDGVLALIEAAERQGVKRFVYTSYSGNIREDSPLETAKRACENRLLGSSMEAVILRPSYFMEVWLSPMLGFDPTNGVARIYGSGNAKVSYISASNVADFAVATAAKEYPQTHVVLGMGGPEALSQPDAARIFEQALNKKIKLEYVPEEALHEQHRSSDPLQKTFGALMLTYAKSDVINEAASVAEQHGIKLRSLSEYASTFRAAATSTA
jgi:uncharacterized protein YbjT (DUF2867 family)